MKHFAPKTGMGTVCIVVYIGVVVGCNFEVWPPNSCIDMSVDHTVGEAKPYIVKRIWKYFEVLGLKLVDNTSTSCSFIVDCPVVKKSDEQIGIAVANLLCDLREEIVSFSQIDIVLSVEFRCFVLEVDGS